MRINKFLYACVMLIILDIEITIRNGGITQFEKHSLYL